MHRGRLEATVRVDGLAQRVRLLDLLDEAARDADPLICAGESFTNVGTLPVWFALSP
jgi:hypothetical protein